MFIEIQKNNFTSQVELSRYPPIAEASREQSTAKLLLSEFDCVFKDMSFISRVIFILDMQRLIRDPLLLSAASLRTCGIEIHAFTVYFGGRYTTKLKHSSVGQSASVPVCVWTTGQCDL